MTNKQTIDGVPRELLVRLCNLSNFGWDDIEPEIKELRALLDKPAGLERAVSLTINREFRVYIAGPMTGLPEFNFPAFNAMAEKMRVAGWHVENPAEHGHVAGAEWADYLRYDIARLATCEAIMLLPGWSKSRGARLEVSIAKELGMPFMFAEGAEHEPTAQPQGEVEPDSQPKDTFNGDNKKLVGCIKALLSLDAAGSLVPHGIGGHARALLEAAAARISSTSAEPKPRGEAIDNPVIGYADSYRAMARQGVETVSIWSVITDLERNIAPLCADQPAPVAVVLPELDSTFESWWESDGQYCRAGGGSYEKTFAYRAYEAALAETAKLNGLKP